MFGMTERRRRIALMVNAFFASLTVDHTVPKVDDTLITSDHG